MLVDTDVLIWHLRGLPQATRRLDQLSHLAIFAITYLELLQGMRSKAELSTPAAHRQHQALRRHRRTQRRGVCRVSRNECDSER